eukprot:2139402-Amphidinium_carterae.1
MALTQFISDRVIAIGWYCDAHSLNRRHFVLWWGTTWVGEVLSPNGRQYKSLLASSPSSPSSPANAPTSICSLRSSLPTRQDTILIATKQATHRTKVFDCAQQVFNDLPVGVTKRISQHQQLVMVWKAPLCEQES